MRILQVTGTSSGGVGRHVREACAALADAGHQVILAAPAMVLDPLAQEHPDARIRTVELDVTDRPRPRADAAAVDHLRRLAAGADVVHAHGLRAGALAVLAVRSLPERRPRVVVTLHNKPVGAPSVQVVGQGLLTVVATGADVVLGVSPDLVAAARSHGARRAEYALVPAPPRILAQAAQDAARQEEATAQPRWGTGVPSTDARVGVGARIAEDRPAQLARRHAALPADVRAALDGDTLAVLTVGRLAPQKGLDVLVEAARIIAARDDVPAWHWFVVGDGPLAGQLADDAAGLPVTPLGRREDVGDLMRGADVVVNTSVWEGQPLVVQEALAAGAAIVATDVGGTGEVARDAAQLVPYDTTALAAALAGVLRDDLRRVALRRAATRRAASLPTTAQLLTQLERVYQL